MKTVVASQVGMGTVGTRQKITNMERLAPGLFADAAQPVGSTERASADKKIFLVLAPDERTFKDWCRQQPYPNLTAMNRVERIRGVRDLQGYHPDWVVHPDKVEIIELPDWRQSMSPNEGQRVEQMLDANFSRQQKARAQLEVLATTPVHDQSPTTPKVSRSRLITVERVKFGHHPAGLSRVRIGRTKERKGAIAGDPLDVVTTQYLDGKATRVASTRLYYQEDEMAFDAVPARTKDITDFGRLTTAAKALAVSMAEYGPDNEPSSEQLAVFIAGYRNLLEWRRKVRQQMTRAEGEIDVVETLLTQIL